MFSKANFTLAGEQLPARRGKVIVSRVGAVVLAAAMALSMMGCFGPRSTDTLIGGAAGAGGGALIGSAVGAPGTGAVLGGLLGAGGGYLIGNAQANAWHQGYYPYGPYY
jgi:osmotically inducible lipoprotein OsmB